MSRSAERLGFPGWVRAGTPKLEAVRHLAVVDPNGSPLAVERRLTALETELKHLATKAWVLAGVVGGMVAAALITLAVAWLVLPVG